MLSIKDLGEAFTQTAGVGECGRNICFSELIDQMPTAVYSTDVEGRVTYFNRAAAQLAGREPQIGSDSWCITWKLYRPDGSFLPHDECPMALALKELRNIRGAEAIVERPDGSRVWVEAYPTVLYGADGQVTGAVNVLIDITERKRAAEALAEADRRKVEFLAQLSHELRNPLSPVRNGLDVLRSAGPLRPPLDRLLVAMDGQVEHLIRLVDDLLDISRISLGKFEMQKQRVDIAVPLGRAVDMSRHLVESEDLDLRLNLSCKPMPVDGDSVRLTQVFSNLLSNAAKHTPRGGNIQITLDRVGSEAVVSVADTGAGISTELLPHIFDPFVQGAAKEGVLRPGLGIGLALARKITEMHGGAVEAKSNGEGRGSVFTVRLPLLGDARIESPAPSRSPARLEGARRVLVVDDVPDVAEALAFLLDVLGAEVRVAHGGEQGLAICSAFEPELVLLDLSMPEMDGFETARRIRETPGGRGVRLVALTGFSEEHARAQTQEAGFDDQLTKPARLEWLEEQLALAPAGAAH